MKLKLQGITAFSATITPPPSKSQTMRALLFALLAKEASTIFNPLISPDTLAMIKAIEQLGAKVCLHQENNKISVIGLGGKLTNSSDKKTTGSIKVIEAGNSGIILRFIGALLGLMPTSTIITGDLSCQKNRVIAPLISGLKMLGAQVDSLDCNQRPPLKIKGPIQPGKIYIDGKDSQPVSAFLIALSFLKGPSEIFVKNAGEKPWIDLTLSWLDFFKIPYFRKGYSYFKLLGNAEISGFGYTVPADFSSLSYPLALAFLTKSHLKIQGLNFQDRQGDKAFISILKKMGANLKLDPKRGLLEIKKKSNTKNSVHKNEPPLKPLKIDAGPIIDMVPLLAVLGSFSKSTTHIYNAFSARFKESDRIGAICKELTKMGAKIEEKPDGMIIYPSNLQKATLSAHKDHRIALALSVAALSISSESTLDGAESISKTYPDFIEKLKNLNQKIK